MRAFRVVITEKTTYRREFTEEQIREYYPNLPTMTADAIRDEAEFDESGWERLEEDMQSYGDVQIESIDVYELKEEQ